MYFTKLRKLLSAHGSIWLSDKFLNVHSRHDDIYTLIMGLLVVDDMHFSSLIWSPRTTLVKASKAAS